jgi:hypothetical protein
MIAESKAWCQSDTHPPATHRPKADAKPGPTIHFMEKPMTKIALCAGIGIAMSLHGVAFAQAWPTRLVRFIAKSRVFAHTALFAGFS